MGRHILPGTRMDVKQDARDMILTTENVVLEQEENFEGRSTNTQLQLQIAVSEPVQSSSVEDSVEPKNEADEAAGLERGQILVAETNKQTVTGSVTARYLPVVSTEECCAVNEPAAQRGLSLETGSTSSRINGADTATPSPEVEVGIKARDEQLGVPANSKRPAVSSPRTASPLWWDANLLADPRETKRSGEMMNRNRQGGSNHASIGPNFSRWESVSCETRTQDPHSSHCSPLDLRVEVNSADSGGSMQVDPVPVSPSREKSPEPTVIPLEERQEQLRLQAIEMRMRSNRTRPTPVIRPVNESSPTCSQSDLLSWMRMVERRNEERERRNAPDKDFTERYNFDIHRDLPLKDGRWEWENVQQP